MSLYICLKSDGLLLVHLLNNHDNLLLSFFNKINKYTERTPSSLAICLICHSEIITVEQLVLYQDLPQSRRCNFFSFCHQCCSSRLMSKLSVLWLSWSGLTLLFLSIFGSNSHLTFFIFYILFYV